jgi:serine/threonine protein kinase
VAIKRLPVWLINEIVLEILAVIRHLTSKKYGPSVGREIEILQIVDHPNCIKMLDYFFSMRDEVTWQNMVFPYYPKSLKNLIQDTGMLSIDVIKRILFQVRIT